MQDLLSGRRRFSQYQYSWKTKKLGELATVKRGASPRPITDPIYFADQGRGWVRISDVTSSPTRFLNRTTQYLSAIGETRSLRVEVGDIIMSICATIGVPKIINIPACIHDGFVLFSDYQEHLDQEFLYHYINFIATKLANQGQPGTQRNLNSEIVRRIDIPHISLDEQREIADVLNAVDHEIDLLIQRLYAIKMEKKGLMQKLLTGQLRIKI
jgi:type I restriction enzyme S subunit